MENRMKKALHRVGILNQVADDIYKIIPNLIQEDNFLDNAEKCMNILDKIEIVKRTI